MAANGLNSFVFKFKNLWRNGQEATLNMKTESGKAWVELHVGLGYPVDLPPPPLQRGIHAGELLEIDAGLDVQLNVRVLAPRYLKKIMVKNL